MNFFAHALPFLDNPFFVAGTCLPDWLSVVNRKVRARQKKAIGWTEDPNPEVAALAGGVVQHHRDDHWFHETAAFAQINLDFSCELRDRLKITDSLRTRFVGHILIEMLLDNFLDRRFPGKLQEFYSQLEQMNAANLQLAAETVTGADELQLASFLPRFLNARFIFDYRHDQSLLMRVNQVLSRIKLPLIGSEALGWLPSARERVDSNAGKLLENYVLKIA